MCKVGGGLGCCLARLHLGFRQGVELQPQVHAGNVPLKNTLGGSNQGMMSNDAIDFQCAYEDVGQCKSALCEEINGLLGYHHLIFSGFRLKTFQRFSSTQESVIHMHIL